MTPRDELRELLEQIRDYRACGYESESPETHARRVARRVLATVEPDMTTNTGLIAEIPDVTNSAQVAGNLVRKGVLTWNGYIDESAGYELVVTPVGRAVLRAEEETADAA